MAREKLDTLLESVPVSFELTESEKIEIEAEARADVEKELKAQKRKEFKDAAKRRLKAQSLVRDGVDETGESVATIFLDLAPAQHFISLDGSRYYHGRTYTLPIGKIQAINDMAYRGHKEESARLGEDMNAFYGRQKMKAFIGPSGLRYQ